MIVYTIFGIKTFQFFYRFIQKNVLVVFHLNHNCMEIDYIYTFIEDFNYKNFIVCEKPYIHSIILIPIQFLNKSIEFLFHFFE